MNYRLFGLAVASLAALLPEASFAQQAPEVTRETSRTDVEQCVAQHDRARQSRLSEQWEDARAAMLSCADDRCPLAIGADCRAWLDELGRVLPTLLVVIDREGSDADWSTLRVELDGQVLQLPDAPVPIELFPGSHRLRIELRGHAAIERNIVLQKGEKNHLEQIRFPEPPRVRVLLRTVSARPRRPVQLSTYLLSAGAIAAFIGSAALLTSALRERADAEANCAPGCRRSVRSAIEKRLLLSDITGGAGIVLGGVAVYTFLRRPFVTSAAHHVGPTLAVNREGLTLFFRGQF